jgi:3-phosphoglycerate kinase
MALVKAAAIAEGTTVSIGLAESDPSYAAYVAPERIDQARRILTSCQSSGTKVHLPVDYVLQDGTHSQTIPEGSAQLDIGPRTIELFSEVIEQAASDAATTDRVLFLNGAMGMFEDPSYSNGTKAVLAAVARASTSGLQTYVGGGDGRAALYRFGHEAAVTHAFTAGGTILKLMSGRAIPYLLSMYLQNSQKA